MSCSQALNFTVIPDITSVFQLYLPLNSQKNQPSKVWKYSTRIEELTNSREAISAKPLGIKLKFFTPLCTYRSSILHKVLERIREFHFFFYKKFFFGFFKILAMKITLDFFFMFVPICEFHLHKFHFLVGIFRQFLWLRH